MEFGISQDQALLQDSVNRFLDAEAGLERVREFAQDPNANDVSADNVSGGGDIWQGLVELGVSALLVPEAAGGVGLTHFEAALVAEALGNHVTPAPFLGSAVLGPAALTRSGHPDDPLLAELAAGRATMGLALSEVAGARADGGVTGNGTQLSGKALFVHDCHATHHLVADTDLRLYLVEAGATGLEAAALTDIDATRVSGSLTFAATPARCLSDDPELTHTLIDIARVMLAADTLGAAQNMLDQAVAYAKEREQFNRPIGSFQAVKHMCAEMAAQLEPCRALVWYAAHAIDAEPAELRLLACHTKAHLAEVGKFVAKTATEVHGGMGFTDLLGLHYWFKRIGYNRQVLGAPELVREQAALAQGL